MKQINKEEILKAIDSNKSVSLEVYQDDGDSVEIVIGKVNNKIISAYNECIVTDGDFDYISQVELEKMLILWDQDESVENYSIKSINYLNKFMVKEIVLSFTSDVVDSYDLASSVTLTESLGRSKKLREAKGKRRFCRISHNDEVFEDLDEYCSKPSRKIRESEEGDPDYQVRATIYDYAGNEKYFSDLVETVIDAEIDLTLNGGGYADWLFYKAAKGASLKDMFTSKFPSKDKHLINLITYRTLETIEDFVEGSAEGYGIENWTIEGTSDERRDILDFLDEEDLKYAVADRLESEDSRYNCREEAEWALSEVKNNPTDAEYVKKNWKYDPSI